MPIIPNAKLKDYAYYATGGTCDVLYAPASAQELAEVMRKLYRDKTKYFLLGGGTNSLVMDEHYAGAVIVFINLQRLETQGTRLVVGAGTENSDVAKKALQDSLQGASWMYRLPGQIGGTVRMNARCYGGEISQIVSQVEVVTPAGDVKTYRKEDMSRIFKGYKDTAFMENGEIIVGVELQLVPGEPKVIEEKMLFCAKDRESKGQFDYPSCGCVFKNDYEVGVSSGILLDTVGAKALKQGGAEVSPHHANFVYNKGASSRSIIELTLRMREMVYKRFGAWIDYEMEILGDLPEDLRRKVKEKRVNRLDAAALQPLRDKMGR